MKILKGGCHIYGAEDDLIQVQDEHGSWQESFVLYFWDVEREVYGFLRVSQEPNHLPPRTVHWIHVWTPTHMYRHVAAAPIAEGAIGRDFLEADGGRCRYTFADGRFHWAIRDESAGLRLDLSLRPFHAGIGPFVAADADYLVTETNTHHIEASGIVTGALAIAGGSYELGGTGWRDHSWGKRDWGAVRAHRFMPALFGPDLGIFCLTFVGANAARFNVASIVRNDTVEVIADFDVVTRMAPDGLSNAGGEIRLPIDGQPVRIAFEPLTSCSASTIHRFALTSTMCRVTMGDRTGVGVTETSNNPYDGTATNLYFAPTTHSENGLVAAHPRPWCAA